MWKKTIATHCYTKAAQQWDRDLKFFSIFTSVCVCVCVRERERKSVCVFCVYSNKLVLKKEAFEFNALQFHPLSLLNEPLHSQQAGTPY